MKSKNMVISFSGVDGAGKTTVLRLFSKKLSDKGHKVVELRSRPSILPILSSFIYGKRAAEQKASKGLPRQGGNKSRLSSWFRFTYYLSDYILGQFYIYVRYTMCGYTIVYDRFYFDYIVDPKRSNLVISSKAAKFFIKFIKQPDINVFLYAPASVILSRKQELSESDILMLTQGYKDLFNLLDERYSHKYLCLKNIELDSTIKVIEDLFLKIKYRN